MPFVEKLLQFEWNQAVVLNMKAAICGAGGCHNCARSALKLSQLIDVNKDVTPTRFGVVRRDVAGVG
jgi:hypothetical protein